MEKEEKKSIKAKDKKMIPIYIMGKKYMVPETLTIMKAIEYSGYKFIRGCGCRGGVCGACATVYRLPDSYKINVGLACQTVIEKDMFLAQIPFYPANKALYNINNLKGRLEEVLKYYPEIARCLCCNTCTRACPQDLEVMDYIQAALKGDLEKAAKLSFECIMCGLCASRCPAEIVHYNVGILCRRLYAKYQVPKAKDLAQRVKEIKEGKYEEELEKLINTEKEKLVELYNKREISE